MHCNDDKIILQRRKKTKINNEKSPFFKEKNVSVTLSGYLHCVKSVPMRSFSGHYSPALGLNTNQKTPNTDTFHAVIIKEEESCRMLFKEEKVIFKFASGATTEDIY